MYIVMLGKPGSGKGTISKILENKLNIVHISSGDIFRNYIKQDEEIGKKIYSHISKGNLVPDDLTIEIFEKRLNEPDCENGVILDGYPRTVKQAEELEKFLNNKGKKVDIAIELDLTDKDIIDRIVKRLVCSNRDCGEIYNLEFNKPKKEGICDKCGSKLIKRDDDNIETVKKRLDVYYQTTAKLIDYYKEKNKLYSVKIDIHSGKTSDDASKEIIKYIENNI